MPGWLNSAFAGAAMALGALGSCLAGPETRIADNVFLVADAKAKAVTLWMIVRAGCRDEAGGQCRGLAHYLEHLMFLGRDGQHNAGAPAAFAAGQTNAFTSMIVTSYYQSVPAREGQTADDLEKMFSIFTERLKSVDTSPQAAARERGVVMQEYNFRRAGSARTKFYADMNAQLQPGHPISQPVIGSRADIDGFSLEAAREFHRRWYAKNNVTFVAYGPFEPKDITPMAAKFIDPLAPGKIPERRWLDARRSFEPMDAALTAQDEETKRAEVLFEKVVRFEDADPSASGAAWSILSDYLNSQIGGSPADVFVERQRALTNVGVSATPLGAGALWYSVSGTLEDGTPPAAMKDAFIDYIRDLAKTGVDGATVERLKKRRAANLAETEKDPQRTLSAFTSWFSGLRTYAEWQARRETLAGVSPAAIQPLLDAMAGPGRQIFGVLSPKK